MTDIVARLRQARADMLGTDDEQHYWDCHNAAGEIERLRLAIRRLAEHDATLSVCDGNVTVTMDATLTKKERKAVKFAAEHFGAFKSQAATLRSLLSRQDSSQKNCTLTDEERGAIEACVDWCDGVASPTQSERADTLRGLLERLGGGE